jgi:hypothetical protein
VFYNLIVWIFYPLGTIFPGVLFENIVNDIISLIHLLVSLLSLYRKATGLCMQILYPATLLKVFMSPNSLCSSPMVL